MDRVDVVTVAGMAGVAAASRVLDPIALAAILGGFVLSLSTWRLWDGKPWEAVGWLAWLVAAVALVVGGGGPLALATVASGLVVGIVLLVGSRVGMTPTVAGTDEREE